LYFKTPKGVWKTPFTRNVKTDLDAPDNSNDQIWPVNRTPNDWDTVKTPDRPLPKNMGELYEISYAISLLKLITLVVYNHLLVIYL